jgi:pyruvate/2-oxoglutarate dehydrogenase complex dihydrolipoamide dehydrogenase (E3) component
LYGRTASAPSIPGLKEAGYLTNETMFSLTSLPRRLAVIGAGPIGCEMAQTFARFGSHVSLIEVLHGILPNEDRDAAQVVQEQIVKDGGHSAVLRTGPTDRQDRRWQTADRRFTWPADDVTVDETLSSRSDAECGRVGTGTGRRN